MQSLRCRAQHHLAVLFAVAALLVAGAMAVAGWGHGISALQTAVMVLLALLAIGLLQHRPSAIKVANTISLLLVIVLPFAVFNPLAVGDYLAVGHEPPSFPASLRWLLPVEIFLLISIHILDAPPCPNSPR